MRFWKKKSNPVTIEPNVIRLIGAEPLDYNHNRDELQPFVPTSLDAAQLNYGQAEGQFRIEDTMWGVYEAESSNEMRLQFEEGTMDPSRFIAHLEAIRFAAEQFFDFPVRIEIEGVHSKQLEPVA